MRGLVLADGDVRFADDLPAPSAGPGECRVRVLQTGVCATDLALAKGYMGFSGVPGHEFVGLALDGAHAGRRVVGEINAGCADPTACPDCPGDTTRHCQKRTVLGILGRSGAFAEELVLPAANLLRVPDAVSNDQAVFTEPLAAAFEIVEQVDLVHGLRALVAGDGRLGLLCAGVLALHGVEVTVAGRHPERQELLPEGVVHTTGLLEAGAPGPESRDFDLAVEATGNPDVLQRLFAWVRPRGTIVLKTTSERPAQLDLAPLVVDELTLLGSRCGRFAPALACLAEGALPVERMIQARFPLEQTPAALARAAEPGVLKVLVEVSQPEPTRTSQIGLGEERSAAEPSSPQGATRGGEAPLTQTGN